MSDMGRVPALNKKKKRRKGLGRLVFLIGWIFFMGLSAVMFFRSPLSKIETIEVSGNHQLEDSFIVSISKIEKGRSFFTANTSQAEQNLKSLPEVKTVQVSRDFPGKILIRLEEYKTVAYLLSDQAKIIPVLENGNRLENRPHSDRVIDKPILRQWTDFSLLPRLAEELLKLDPAVMNVISEIEPAPGNDPQRLLLYMKDGYEVHTSIRNFAKNMAWYPSFVMNLRQEGKEQGIIMLLDGKWFVPYENLIDKEEDTADENS